ncbi:MAG: hypothetical protein ABIP91_00375 [Sphingomicrobium sp.]
MLDRLRPGDMALALLIALPTLALPAPGNAATEIAAPSAAMQLADSHADRLAAVGHGAGQNTMIS